MKLKFTCEVDFDVLQRFIETLNKKLPSMTIDSFIENKMKDFVGSFVEDLNDLQNGSSYEGSDINSDNAKLVEELMEKSKEFKIGQLAQQILMSLLELRVMTDEALEEMQKASGAVQVDRLEIEFGRYNKNNFNMSYPLLVTPETRALDEGNNFFARPLTIGNQRFYLVSQWNEKNHREKLENWIRENVKKFLENADENQVKELKKIIRGI